MKNLKLKNILIAFLLIFSCSDDFVNVDSLDQNSEDFFNSEEEYYDALVGAYDGLQWTYVNVMLGEIASDNTLCGGESATDVVGFQEIDDMVHTPVNSNLRDIWSWMYGAVNRANYILEFQNKTEFPSKNSVIAQAKFLRAYYYFELVKWFGDVPFAVDKRIQFGDQFEIDRTPRDVIYKQIVDDLNFAILNLSSTQPSTGMITKGAAQALLGKAYLYWADQDWSKEGEDNVPLANEKYALAASALEDVINSGIYSLVKTTRIVEDIEIFPIFENDFENNSESVFEIQYSDKEGAGFGCLQCSEGNVAVGFNGIRNYTGPVFESGFSFNVPTQKVVDAFEDGDIRKNTAILEIDTWADATSATFSTGYEHTGYFNRKYISRQGDLNTGDANLTNPNNYRAIRYADVLLMAAEAKAEIGDLVVAKDYLNEVRRRAFGLADNDNSRDVTSTNKDDLIDAIYHERQVELVGEGHRFFDLVRTGRAEQEINGFTVGKNEIFPIPLIEIQLAGNRWEQNPNY